MLPLLIEINLLPDEHRGPEGPPAPLYAAVAGAVALAAAATFFVVTVNQTHSAVASDVAQKSEVLRGLDKQTKEIEQLEKAIAGLGKREDRILALAESRTPWALKLVQLHRALPEELWIEKIQLQPGPSDKPGRVVLTLVTYAQSADASDRVAEIRRILASDPAFFHHFNAESTPEDQYQMLPPANGGTAWQIRFTINLPLAA